MKKSVLLLVMLPLLFTCRGAAAADQAPDFSVTDASGHALRLADLRGKIVLLDFWATWCPPCRAEVPNVVETFRRFAPKGLVIVGVSLDRDMDVARRFIADKGMGWTHVLDRQAADALAESYGVEYIPATFIIDGQGRIVARNLRGQELQERIARLLGS